MGIDREIVFAPFRLDLRERRLLRDGEEIRLQPKTFDLLALLAGRPGELVPREEVIAAIWPDVVVSDDSLFRLVREARRALGDSASDPCYIETVPRVGLRFIAPVTPPEAAPGRRRPRLVAGASALAFALALGLALLWALVDGRGDREGDRGSEPAPGEGASELPAAPAVDVSRLNAEREYQLGLRALARRAGFEVLRAYQHFEAALAADPDHAGAMAGLALAMTLTPWADIADGQRRIRALAERALDIDSDLAMAYLARGKLDSRFAARYGAARAAMERVLELDPDNAEAHLVLATLAISEGRYRTGLELQRAGLGAVPDHRSLIGNLALTLAKLGRFEEAEELLDSAAQSLGPILTARGLIYAHTGRRIEQTRVALEWFERTPLTWLVPILAGELLAIGDRAGARRLLVAEVNCEPGVLQLEREGALRLAAGGRPRQALLERWAPRREYVGSLDPLSNRLWRARLAIAEGALEEAVAAYREAFPSPAALTGWQGSIEEPAGHFQWLAHALVASDRAEEARPWLDAVERALADRIEAGLFPELHFVTLLQARNAALGGERERALAALEQLVARGWVDVAALDDPRWAPIRDDPRFDAVLRQVRRRADEIRAELEADDLQTRLAAAIAAHPRVMVEGFKRLPQALVDPIPIPEVRACLERLRDGDPASAAALAADDQG